MGPEFSAGLFCAATITATILNQQHVIAAKVAEQAKNKDAREALGSFMAEGLKLIAGCSDKSAPPNWPQLNDWINRIKTFLRLTMGDSYVVRIDSPAGAAIDRECRNADAAHNQLHKVVTIINFRLDQFSSEIGR